MINDRWVLHWKNYLSDNYAYGSEVRFMEDGKVHYRNELIPPGTVLHTWYSKTNFQADRIEPSLPLIDGESAYELKVNIEYVSEKNAGIMFRVVFFDRYDKEFDSYVLRNDENCFKPPITMYSFRIEMICAGCREFIFDSIVLREISEDELDAYNERIRKTKKYSKKSKG